MRTAVILAAGRGTRMGTLTAECPKPLLRVGGAALIEHIVRGFVAGGIDGAVVVVGYRGEQIQAALGDGEMLGLTLRYCQQEGTSGTAGALLVAEALIEDDEFALSWGDVLVDRSFYREFLRRYAAARCPVQLAVNPTEDPWQGAAVYVDDDWRVTRLDEKPPRGTATTPWNNAGIFAFDRSVFQYARALTPSPRGEYELPRAVGLMIAAGLDIRAVPVQGFWSDVGTPADLARAEQEYRAN